MDEAEKGMARMEAIIHSMTPAGEKRSGSFKSIKKAQNRKRTGVDISEVNRMDQAVQRSKEDDEDICWYAKRQVKRWLSKNGYGARHFI